MEQYLPKLDLNVIPVYKMGYTGRGIRISILDDGIEHTHDDLKNNYVSNFQALIETETSPRIRRPMD